jgi:hypothetical protein
MTAFQKLKAISQSKYYNMLTVRFFEYVKSIYPDVLSGELENNGTYGFVFNVTDSANPYYVPIFTVDSDSEIYFFFNTDENSILESNIIQIINATYRKIKLSEAGYDGL